MLAEVGASTEAVDAGGRTALHLAAERGHVECLRVLADHGASTEAVDGNGRTALHLAAWFCPAGKVEETLTVLVDVGVRKEVRNKHGRLPVDWLDQRTVKLPNDIKEKCIRILQVE